MNPATSSEKPPGRIKKLWVKAVARRLRDWLNGFLLEPGGSAVGAGHGGGGALSSPASSSRSPQNQGPGQMSERGDQTEAHPEGPAEEAVLPEAWLAFVRERSPELLLPVEEGRAPWQELSSAAMEESESLEERLSPPTGHVPLAESRYSRKPPWRQFLKREFGPGVSTPLPEEEESQPGRDHAASPLGTKRHSAGTAEHAAPTPAPSWSDRIKQKLQRVLYAVPASEFLTKVDVPGKQKTRKQTKQESPASPSTGMAHRSITQSGHQPLRSPHQLQRHSRHVSGFVSREAGVMRSHAKVDRGSSEPSARLHRPEQVFIEVKHNRGQSQSKTSASTMNPMRWPPSPDSAETDRGKFDKRALPAALSTPNSGVPDSGRFPKSEWNDPWPELPEDPPASDVRWLESLHRSEHLSALDLEQRGGR
jgi:hypothetical protein